jgi:hypothetical protein
MARPILHLKNQKERRQRQDAVKNFQVQTLLEGFKYFHI